MREKIGKDGQPYWEPVDPDDAKLLAMAEGVVFKKGCTFPSGWRTPPGAYFVHDGLLYRETNGSEVKLTALFEKHSPSYEKPNLFVTLFTVSIAIITITSLIVAVIETFFKTF